ncbi:MAG: type II toxin-antitoxin system Phd/YefM family antitoxin [Aulosira sp. DedQUE10]|nr:type II toxin-antitoxin system Phd/YefM family antitoxin [Aulosira sp. DedQUE10]
MSQQYSIEQIPVNFNRIIEEVEQGEPIQITRQGKQVAVILSTAEYERLVHKNPRFWESVVGGKAHSNKRGGMNRRPPRRGIGHWWLFPCPMPHAHESKLGKNFS